MALMKQNHFRQPEKTEQDMNYQNINKNSYAPPKSAFDFGLTEKGTKKQRIARVFLGVMSVPLIMTIVSFVLSNHVWINNTFTENIILFFMGLFTFILVFIVPSAIFAIIIEYFDFTGIHKIIIAFIAGIAIPYSIQLIYFLMSKESLTFVRPYFWSICGVLSTIIAVFIMQVHQKHYQRKRLQIPNLVIQEKLK